MSTPPPARPSGNPNFAATSQVPKKQSKESSTTKSGATSASILPLISAVVAIAISILIFIMTAGKSASISEYLIGYFLTPIVVAVCMGWDSVDQRKKVKGNPYFKSKPQLTLILRVLTGLSFIVAFPHIHSIAGIIGEKLAGS